MTKTGSLGALFGPTLQLMDESARRQWEKNFTTMYEGLAQPRNCWNEMVPQLQELEKKSDSIMNVIRRIPFETPRASEWRVIHVPMLFEQRVPTKSFMELFHARVENKQTFPVIHMMLENAKSLQENSYATNLRYPRCRAFSHTSIRCLHRNLLPISEAIAMIHKFFGFQLTRDRARNLPMEDAVKMMEPFAPNIRSQAQCMINTWNTHIEGIAAGNHQCQRIGAFPRVTMQVRSQSKT
jgi:hypothetical protein